MNDPQAGFEPMTADRTLVVGMPLNVPYIYPCALEIGDNNVLDPSCEYPGIDFEIFSYISQIMNITIRYYPIAEVKDWGSTTDQGLLTLLANGTVDTLNTWYSITVERSKFFDFTFNIPYACNRIGFILSKPGQGMHLGAEQLLQKVFAPPIWFSACALIVLLSSLLFFTNTLKKWRNGGLIKSIRDFDYSGFWSTLTLVVNQFNESVSKASLTGNMLVVFLGFTVLFVTTLYQGGLVNSLIGRTAAYGKLPFRSMTELAELVYKGKQKVIYDCGLGSAHFWGLVRGSDLSAYRVFNKSLSSTTTVHICDETAALDSLEGDPSLVYPGQYLLTGGLRMMKGRCNLMFIEDMDSTSVSMSGFIFRKNDTFLKLYNSVMPGMASMVQHTEQKYILHETDMSSRQCVSQLPNGGDPMVIRHFHGIVAVCGLMVGMAAGAMAVEIGFRIMKNRILERVNRRKSIIQIKVRTVGALRRASELSRRKSLETKSATIWSQFKESSFGPEKPLPNAVDVWP